MRGPLMTIQRLDRPSLCTRGTLDRPSAVGRRDVSFHSTPRLLRAPSDARNTPANEKFASRRVIRLAIFPILVARVTRTERAREREDGGSSYRREVVRRRSTFVASRFPTLNAELGERTLRPEHFRFGASDANALRERDRLNFRHGRDVVEAPDHFHASPKN